MSDTAHYELQSLRERLQQLADGSLSPHGFSDSARSLEALLAALPARYAEVLFGLLDRLESGALFTEESCSFSLKDLTDNLRLWADKAEAQLQRS
ncbi:hypothetical protein H9K76_22180 [Diaphorobacter ruginosibacter]|uniref:Uncharacterized protein n=1 Tax=Diaphorobacter ruginosibacter TaxID=1715720 RepID=A0A7G9RNH2_9BURK|nr:hypothetical protein [Diaphorobacter ruginosibacter]QNN57147.1 hypothetical protein H9K76_22180 [Diaphorobacter ruginosibacter]